MSFPVGYKKKNNLGVTRKGFIVSLEKTENVVLCFYFLRCQILK